MVACFHRQLKSASASLRVMMKSEYGPREYCDVPFSGVDANSANSANHTDYLEPPVLVEYPAM